MNHILTAVIRTFFLRLLKDLVPVYNNGLLTSFLARRFISLTCPLPSSVSAVPPQKSATRLQEYLPVEKFLLSKSRC